MEFMDEASRFEAGVIPRQPDLRTELEALNERKWDLLDEIREVDVARAAIMNTLKGQRTTVEIPIQHPDSRLTPEERAVW